jgi:hypothetical protein
MLDFSLGVIASRPWRSRLLKGRNCDCHCEEAVFADEAIPKSRVGDGFHHPHAALGASAALHHPHASLGTGAALVTGVTGVAGVASAPLAMTNLTWSSYSATYSKCHGEERSDEGPRPELAPRPLGPWGLPRPVGLARGAISKPAFLACEEIASLRSQ